MVPGVEAGPAGSRRFAYSERPVLDGFAGVLEDIFASTRLNGEMGERSSVNAL